MSERSRDRLPGHAIGQAAGIEMGQHRRTRGRHGGRCVGAPCFSSVHLKHLDRNFGERIGGGILRRSREVKGSGSQANKHNSANV